LYIHPGEQVAFVGAGGKTSAAWRVLTELAAEGHPVVFTTTTRVFEPEGVPLLLEPDPSPAAVRDAMGDPPFLVLAAGRGERYPGEVPTRPYKARPVKLVGLAPDRIDRLARALPAVTWLVEADGAKRRKLKAPAEYEPVIPSEADRVVVVGGLAALGRPLDERTVHRPERAARLLGTPIGTVITPGMVAALLAHPQGGLKGIPRDATVVALLTQQEGSPHPQAAAVAQELLSSGRITRVVLADLYGPEPVLEVWE
jgi:probable selenium-dependent hydroxylase accessory protein YqeC